MKLLSLDSAATTERSTEPEPSGPDEEHFRKLDAKLERKAAKTGQRLARDAIRNFHEGGELRAHAPIDTSFNGWGVPNPTHPMVHFGETAIYWGPRLLDKASLLPALNSGLSEDGEEQRVRITDVDVHAIHSPSTLREHIHVLFGKSIFEFELEEVVASSSTDSVGASLPNGFQTL